MQGFSIEAQDNTVCTFGSDLIDKYEKGIKQNNFKRKDGAEIERLKQISLAVMALKKPNKGIWVLNGHNPPQIAYLHASRNTGFCVYIDQETKKVRAYMPVSNVRKKIEELK